MDQIKTMESLKRPGVIINLGSASGLYPLSIDPAYTASKGVLSIFYLLFYFLSYLVQLVFLNCLWLVMS